MTHCPAHEDRSPSFSVTERDGRMLVHCLAGCRQIEVLEALRARRLWHEPAAALPPSAQPLTPEQERARAFTEIASQARHEAWARPGVIESYRAADQARETEALPARLRAAATRAGDTAHGWDIAALAAAMKRARWNGEDVAS